MRRKLTLFSLLLPLLLLTGALIPNTVHASPTIETLRPNAVGTYTQWSTVYPSSTAHWDAVDDVSPDGDATYIQTSTYGHKDTFQLPDIPTDAVVSRVEVWLRAKCQPDGRILSFIVRTHGENYFFEWMILAYDYATQWHTWWTNPNTGDDWTAAEVNDLEVGVECRELFLTGGWMRVTWVAVYVEYTLPEIRVPEFGLSIPIITSILTAVYLLVGQRLGRRKE